MARVVQSSSKSKTQLIIAGFLSVKNTLNIQQKWISDHVIAEIAGDIIKIDDKLTTTELNNAVGRYYKDKCDILSLHHRASVA